MFTHVDKGMNQCNNHFKVPNNDERKMANLAQSPRKNDQQ